MESASRFPLQRGGGSVAWVPADGSGPAETLAPLGEFGAPTSWSPDGKLLAFTSGGRSISDIRLLPGPGVSGDRKPQSFLQTQFAEMSAVFSPDGRWIAYASDETGSFEVYVRPAPSVAGPAAAAGGKWQVSTDGGVLPRWARSGRELFYRNVDKTMVVQIEPGPTFRYGTPKLVFTYPSPIGTLDVSPNGKRFLMLKRGAEQEAGPPQVHIVLEWFEEIRRRVRAGG